MAVLTVGSRTVGLATVTPATDLKSHDEVSGARSPRGPAGTPLAWTTAGATLGV